MLKIIAAASALLASVGFAQAQAIGVLSSGCGTGNMTSGIPYLTVDNYGRLCGSFGPSAAQTISGNAVGTTAAVVGTLAAAAGKTTYICGFNVNAIGGTASVGPITIAGLVGSSQVYQTDVNSATVGKQLASAQFTPCLPASALNTAITITTTAAAGGTAVDVNSWGYQQ